MLQRALQNLTRVLGSLWKLATPSPALPAPVSNQFVPVEMQIRQTPAPPSPSSRLESHCQAAPRGRFQEDFAQVWHVLPTQTRTEGSQLASVNSDSPACRRISPYDRVFNKGLRSRRGLPESEARGQLCLGKKGQEVKKVVCAHLEVPPSIVFSLPHHSPFTNPRLPCSTSLELGSLEGITIILTLCTACGCSHLVSCCFKNHLLYQRDWILLAAANVTLGV